MPKLQTLGFFVVTLAAPGETVVWKASGTLDEGTGIFLREDFPAGAPVTMRVTYDDTAIAQNRVNLPFPGKFEDDYRTDLKLNIVLTIGSLEWQGSVDSASPDSPTTFHTFTFDYPAPEAIELTIDSSDQGTFPEFPFRIAEEPATFALSFRGADNTFLGPGIAPSAIAPPALATASGTISNGSGNELSFTLEPSSFEVFYEKNEAIPPVAPLVSGSVGSDTISLTWLSDIRFRYRIEATSDLSTDQWTEIETRNGTSTPLTRSYPLANTFRFYRVVAIER